MGQSDNQPESVAVRYAAMRLVDTFPDSPHAAAARNELAQLLEEVRLEREANPL